MYVKKVEEQVWEIQAKSFGEKGWFLWQDCYLTRPKHGNQASCCAQGNRKENDN